MRRILLAVVAAVAVVVPATAAMAGYPPGITVNVTPSTATEGTPRTVSGDGCVPSGTTVSLSQGGTPAGTTSSSGGTGSYSFSGLFASLPAGTYPLTVTCGDEQGTTSFVVQPLGGTTSTTATTAPTSTTAPSTADVITASPSTLAPGQSFEVYACCFAPGASVEITFESTPVLLATVVAGSDGAVRATVAVPAGATLGAHTVRAVGLGADGAARNLVTSVTIGSAVGSAAVPASSAGSTSTSSLPVTGSNATSLALWALGLVAAGGGAVAVARRRRLAQV